MNRTIILLCCSLTLLVPLQAQQDTTAEGPAKNALQPIERFNNRQMTLAIKGKPASAHVTVHDWLLHGKQKVDRFPATGQLLVQLHSGRITTVINGKEEKREPGDFWTVPAGASMAVTVTSESAALHVVGIDK